MKTLGSLIGTLLGSAVSLIFMAIGVMSLPFNIIALMRWMGWEWWTALIAAIFLNVIPVIGQIAYVVFAFAGAYFFTSAGFSWQEAVHPATVVSSLSTMSDADWESYKARVIQPEWARQCKNTAVKRYATAEGKLPIVVSNYCDCVARVGVAILTRDDMTHAEKNGQVPLRYEGRFVAAIEGQCSIVTRTDQPEAAVPLEDGGAAFQRGDHATAFKIWSTLAEQGDPKAQHNLGSMYYRGDGVKQDRAEAAKWWHRASEQGLAFAQSNLGNLYLELGNHAEAVKWWRKAGEQGHPQAQFNVGNSYQNGEGVAKDFVEAVKWFRLAAEQGYAESQYQLGNQYSKGEGVRQDHSEAVRWFRQAAEQGVAAAQNDLAVSYASGRGVPKNVVLAYMWATLSIARDNTISSAFRTLLAKEMTPAQIAEAQKLAREWKPTVINPALR
jgi:uncharacterized protein